MTRIDVCTGQTGLSFETDRLGQLRQMGFRPRPADGSGITTGSFPPEAFPLAYPAWGQVTGVSPALRLTGHDGQAGCYLTLAGQERSGDLHRIRVADAAARVAVDLCFRTYPDTDVIEQWAEVSHEQAGPVTVHAAAAAAPVLVAPRPWLTRYDGDWAAEWTPATAPVPVGTTVIQSFGAVRPHLQASPFFLLAPDGPAVEQPGGGEPGGGEPGGGEPGTVLAGSLAWGGGIRFAFERQIGQPGLLRVLCGQHPMAGYQLDPAQVFRTPRMIWAWSAAGTRPLTHRLHRWVRENALRDGGRVRATVFNTWEAAGFNFDQARLAAMMAGAADLGAELFLLDDGWFGTDFPRNGDTAGLGDWEPDPAKLPDGIGGLTAAASRHGLRFGLWMEPEMVNPASRLYRERPDWVVSEPGRDRREQRNQLVLDLCRAEVRDFVAGTVDRLLADTPGISYLKWDANRDISEPGSGVLAADRQGNLWTDTVHARWQVMEAVARRWPDTELMLCASGGGRTDLGTLRWFHEVWLSDNTDAVTRLKMQWAASSFLPPQAIAAHVTRWGEQDVAFACAVAMSARFGFDLDPAALTAAELAACRRAAALYREVRDLVQLGDLFRLIGPDAPGSGGRVALGYADAGRRRGVVFGYQLADGDGPGPGSPCPVPWAQGGCQYRIRQALLTEPAESIRVTAGADLLADGLPWPLREARTAVIWLAEEVNSDRC